MPTNIDREALLNALHDAIDGDMLIDGDGDAIGLSEAGAADVTRWAADALTEHIADAVKAAETEGFERGAAAVRERVTAVMLSRFPADGEPVLSITLPVAALCAALATEDQP